MTEKVRNSAPFDQIPHSCPVFTRLFFAVLFSVVLPLFLPQYSPAQENETIITSDSLEYFHDTNKYVATGSVQLVQEGAFLTADKITYDGTTSDAVAQGKVDYHDANTSMKAEKAELNLQTKTGNLHEAEIFYEEDNLHISGGEIEKKGEDAYYSPEAVFTTCDAPVPAWCFKAKNVDAVTGGRLTAVDGYFKIKNVPVLYTPYLWSPVLTTRETGFLMPVISQSKSHGFGLKIPFFWAISENRDATFLLDVYSKSGIGEGMEYRFVEPGVKGFLWAYHIRDTQLDKDFSEFNARYENRSSGDLGGFLNVNLVNEKDFYQRFSPELQIRTQRFLESTGELNYSLTNSRLYLLSQYWIDLAQDAVNGKVPQKLPEAGYVMNYTKLGDALVSASLSAANIWRDKGLSTGRIDLYPKLLYSFGKDFVVTQTAAVRETAYSFYNDDTFDNNVQRTAFEYDAIANTRLYKRYDSFLHVIEPSVRYHLITSSDDDLPVLDATELFKKTSRFELGLLNRAIINGNEVVTARLTQGIETYNGVKPLLPLNLDLAINKWVPIKFDATYNLYTGLIETLNSDLSLSIFKANLSLGESYNRVEDVLLYKAGLEFAASKQLSFKSRLWYDAKGGGLRDMHVTMKYEKQCWGVRLEMIKKPGDYTMVLMFDLAGISGKHSKDNNSQADSPDVHGF